MGICNYFMSFLTDIHIFCKQKLQEVQIAHHEKIKQKVNISHKWDLNAGLVGKKILS